MTCPFCAIERGDAPAKLVHKGRAHLAFEDKHPRGARHVIVCPSAHAPTLHELPPSEQMQLLAMALEVAQQLRLEQYRLVMNVGPRAGQRVMHAHVHLIAGG